ncbi:hypothetical protein EXIGLDRAFT_704027 [Exidia glandulosa HHB12029]|uniref:R3H-associated N-terminal domain-containing protein n=1 Tax=Exidia glandulosa HHB12029 TaxID=1314781 RepID=A0A165L1P0_EXIGL|nr:hypothetical protein EXIGLDRAFT_704027 [Exidia glandulosa HHB12029]
MAAAVLDNVSLPTLVVPGVRTEIATYAPRNRDGRRKQRRREDARFAGNPHVVAPSKADYELFLPRTKATFPAPLPAGLARTTAAPSYARPTYDPASARAGHFRMSMRGVRRALRGSGPRMQALVAAVEDALLGWRDAIGAFGLQSAPYTCPAEVEGMLYEIRRTPGELVWAIPDPWTRYVVHCVARFHGVVSVSTDDSGAPGGRATRLLKPHITRMEARHEVGMHTPATTDHETSSAAAFETELSDIDSESDLGAMSDVEPASTRADETDETPRPRRVISGSRAPLTIVEDLAEGDDEGDDDDSDGFELLSASSASLQRD